MKKIFKSAVSVVLVMLMVFGSMGAKNSYKFLITEVEAAVPSGEFLWPVPSSYSMSRAYTSSHKAIDIQKCANQDILASYDGVVYKLDSGTNSSSKTDSTYGTSMIIKHSINGSVYYTHYAHMVEGSIPQKFRTIGATVKQGEVIGKVGETGNATGYHLHFCIADGSDVWNGRFNNTPTDSRHNITSANGVSYKYELHTHNYSIYSHDDTSHPHYSYYKCSCGEIQKNWNNTNFDSSCVRCNPSAFCVNLGDDFYGVILNTACWKPISKTAGTNNISLQTENGSSMQKWRFQRQSDGAYVITSCYDGTALEMTDGKKSINLDDYSQISSKDGYWGGNYQQWYLIPQGSGLTFLSKHYADQQWVMDLYDGNVSDGTAIGIQPNRGNDAQIWSVYNRDEVQLQPANLSANVENTKVTFTWPNAYGATSYSLKICKGEAWNGQGEVHLRAENVKSGYSVELPEGTYYAYIDSEDYYSYIMSNVVTISIGKQIHTVTYNANGGIGAPVSQEGKETIILSDVIPERAGYNFLGWSDNIEATEANYLPGEILAVNSDVSLFAVWEKVKLAQDYLIGNAYGVYFEFPGQTFCFEYIPSETRSWCIQYFKGVSNSTGKGLGLYLYDDKGNQLSSATDQDGYNEIIYEFKSGEKYYIKLDTSLNNPVSAFIGIIGAKTTYTLSYNANGGTGVPAEQKGSTGYVIPGTEPVRDGFTFVGWAESTAVRSPDYVPGDSIILTQNTTLYAVWERTEEKSDGYKCPKCGEEFSDEDSYNQHLALEDTDNSSSGGGFFSFLINIFLFIIGLLTLPFKMIF